MSVDDLFPDGMVTQSVVIVELLADDGQRYFQIKSADANGEPLPWWTVEGLLNAAVQTYESVPPFAPAEPEDEDWTA